MNLRITSLSVSYFKLQIGSYQLIFTSYYSSLKNKNDLFQVMMPVLGTGMNSPVIPLM